MSNETCTKAEGEIFCEARGLMEDMLMSAIKRAWTLTQEIFGEAADASACKLVLDYLERAEDYTSSKFGSVYQSGSTEEENLARMNETLNFIREKCKNGKRNFGS